MRAQFIQSVQKNTAAEIGIYIYDGGGAALTGLVASDIRVAYLKQDGTSFVGKTLASLEEVGDGKYNIPFTAEELDTTGILIVKITPDPGYAGTMLQSTKPVGVSDSESLLGGFLQDKPQWVPVQAALSSVPVGGLGSGDILLSDYQKQGENTYAAIALTASNFREILDLGNPTGIYQVYLDENAFNFVGVFTIRLQGATFDDFFYSYQVGKALSRPVYVSVVDGTSPSVGTTVYAVDEKTALVVQTKTTDGLGRCLFELPDGDYVFVLASGSQIFTENNYRVTVVDPNSTIVGAKQAEALSGNMGPFALSDGMTLEVQVAGGEQQVITFSATDFIAPSTISSATADVVAELINRKSHSLTAYTSGLNNTQLLLQTLVAGQLQTLQVLGGTANAVFNFPTDLKTGENEKRQTNRVTFNGAVFQPGFAAPSTDLVEMTFRVVDLAGAPVKGVEVQIVNNFNPSVLATDGSAVLGRKVLQCFTDADGVLQEDYTSIRPGEQRGKPKLMKGAVVDVIITGTDIVKQGITVPPTNFNLTDEVLSAEDLFTIQQINLPRAPRNSP